MEGAKDHASHVGGVVHEFGVAHHRTHLRPHHVDRRHDVLLLSFSLFLLRVCKQARDERLVSFRKLFFESELFLKLLLLERGLELVLVLKSVSLELLLLAETLLVPDAALLLHHLLMLHFLLVPL